MRRALFTTLLLTIAILLTAQNVRKPLTWDDIESWRRVTETVISPDGSYVAYKSEPWKGDQVIKVYDKKGKEVATYSPATGLQFTYDSRHLLFTIKPSYEVVRELKQAKAKREDMPSDTLAIWSVEGAIEKIPGIRSFSIPAKWSGWLAYQTEPAAPQKASASERNEKPSKKESATNGYKLNFRNLKTGQTISFPFVTQVQFASERPLAFFVTTGDENGLAPGLYIYDFDKGESRAVKTGKGEYRQVTFNGNASAIAFLFNGDPTDKLSNRFSLWYGITTGESTEILSGSNTPAPAGWIISDNGRLSFSESGGKIFFFTAPANRQKDTTRLEEDYPNVDIWHWNEGTLHTQQVINRNRDARRSYQAVYSIESKKSVQLANPAIPDITLINKGDHDMVIATSGVPYQVEAMWESTPGKSDIYLVDMNSGTRELLKQGFRGRMQPSPSGKYLYWFDAADSSWYTMGISDRIEYRITAPASIKAASETNDVPNPPGSYSLAGWVKDDQAIVVYDRFDLWKVDPRNAIPPVRITTSGREKSIVYRAVRFDREKEYFDPSEKLYLTGHNDITRAEGIYSVTLSRPGTPSTLFEGDFALGTPLKASGGNTVILTTETFERFPDLHLTDTEFKKQVRISDVNPQQNSFIWGRAEVVSWTSLDGIKVEGLLFVPQDFNPSKKYPMIVNFYEKSSQELHSYRNPELHRSTIDYHYYTSNGYIVFNPDVHYRDGYPGESAYNCVMPGITSLIARGFVDEARIGAQGHSWGGYQVAYMATRTNIFACIESGAPVVNMFSAYGGIRWETGLSRAFQYEHQQSRIGLSIWESPLRYLENSPLFTMDKVNTPILIMANDQDGHVPWYQGIEYFLALRRLGKPAWMLNYTGEPHWPQKPQNKKDFQIRMGQFFDHYLKGKPMPLWMKEGVPAVDKDFELGYGYK
jgi:dipeptidyl aminopeptidase/acylaminoacyl peptidase